MSRESFEKRGVGYCSDGVLAVGEQTVGFISKLEV